MQYKNSSAYRIGDKIISVSRLAKEAGVSEEQVHQSIKKLSARGYILIEDNTIHITDTDTGERGEYL